MCYYISVQCKRVNNNGAHTHTLFSFTHNITDSFIILSLIKSQLPRFSFSQSLFSLFHPSSPPPPCHQSEGAGSIVIGLQSWQPYDWAVGYCNWIRLEISAAPVRLLKTRSVVHSWRLPFTLFFFCVNGSRSKLLLLSEEVRLCDCESDTCEAWPWEAADLMSDFHMLVYVVVCMVYPLIMRWVQLQTKSFSGCFF